VMQGVLYWLWSRCVRDNSVAMFSVHKCSTIDLSCVDIKAGLS